MFVDLDWPLNASSLLSASAELLVTYIARVKCLMAAQLWSNMVCCAWLSNAKVTKAKFGTNYPCNFQSRFQFNTISHMLFSFFPIKTKSSHTTVSEANLPIVLMYTWLFPLLSETAQDLLLTWNPFSGSTKQNTASFPYSYISDISAPSASCKDCISNSFPLLKSKLHTSIFSFFLILLSSTCFITFTIFLQIDRH